MGNGLYALAVAAGSFLLFVGVGRPLSPASPESGRAMIQAALERFTDVAGLEDVHFDFGSSRITLDGLRVLDANVARLKRLAPRQILIEGHTDEWGSEEFNLRLGERRARAVQTVLLKRGVSPSAITTMSYGKARPHCLEHHRVCWAENRRVHLQVSVSEPDRPRPLGEVFHGWAAVREGLQ